MKKLLCLLLCLLLLPSAMAEAPVGLPLAEPLSGVYRYPDGADESTARYSYLYAYPQVNGTDEIAAQINGFYQYLVEDAMAFAIPMAIELLEPDAAISSYTDITSEVTCNNGQYLSVRVSQETMTGTAASTVLSGQTFALHGDKAGSVISLPYLLGILNADESDPWMQDRQTAKADELVRTLVWDVIQEQLAEGAVAYYDELTFEAFSACFYPEEDFYMDEDGNLVFFLQEASVAPAVEGILLFPFTLEELLDEL